MQQLMAEDEGLIRKAQQMVPVGELFLKGKEGDGYGRPFLVTADQKESILPGRFRREWRQTGPQLMGHVRSQMDGIPEPPAGCGKARLIAGENVQVRMNVKFSRCPLESLLPLEVDGLRQQNDAIFGK